MKAPEEIIIAKEKAALERWGKGDIEGYLELFADEMTYFDPSLDDRKDGLMVMKEYLLPINGKIHVFRFEMINPKVQLHGDVGLLTFNLIDYSEDGKISSSWNSTEVYCKIENEWKIIHSHWSYTKPE